MKLSCVGLIILLALGCRPSTPPDAQPPPKFKTLTIKASGEVETLPDEASFRVRLECLRHSVKASKACLVEQSNALNQQLLDLGIAQRDILTTAVDMNKRYAWQNNSRVFRGYESATTVYVTVKDLEMLDEIYTELIENRGLNLGQLSYTHSRMDSLRNEAYVKALRNARNLADRLVAELPETDAEILKVGNVQITASTPESAGFASDVVEEMALESDAHHSIAISRGTVVVSATLFVEFQID